MIEDPKKSPKTAGARELAVKILAEAEARDRQVEDLLAATLKQHPDLPKSERGFLLELVQGVKRWELRLDYTLSGLSRLPWRQVHPLVRHILRLAAYQLLFLDKVPVHAAVDEAVKLARRRGLPPSHLGFINAILRRVARGEVPPLPRVEEDPVTALAAQTAHPAWLVARWLARYGLEDTRARLEANKQIPPLTVRVNTLKTAPSSLMARLEGEGVKASPGRFSPVGLVFESVERPPESLPSFREGLWLFQDEAAQLAASLLPVSPGQRVLEIGAGRGGKTTHLGEMLENRGLILAVDYHRGRLGSLSRNLERWGVTCAQPLRADAAQALPVRPDSLDAVLIDAPCSALGIMRRHPEIKTRLNEADLGTFPLRQRRMLDAAAPLLKAGGHLLYITCTTEPEENEDLIAGFLAEHPEYHLVHEPEILPRPARDLFEPSGFFRTSPARQGLDGFFAALLRRG
ncbi:MAG: 16S rRNA (cytosine(967)-C(5))-methyltransferase RsmB [Thermodesulfobacteriota bacterium]